MLRPMNRRTLPRAGLWLCLFFLALPAGVRAAEPSTSPFVVDSWDSEAGLPDNEVISVIQGRDGYLWLGTLNGLVRFDGIHFTVFNVNNTPGLDSDRIVYLFEDSRTNLWVGTEAAGFERISCGTIQNFGGQNGGAKIISAAEDSSGVWFHTADGLYCYHDGKMNFYPGVISTQLLLLESRAEIPSKSGGFWRLLNGTVEKINDGRVEKNLGAFPWGNAVVQAALEDDRGNLIVGTLGAGIFWSDAAGHWQNISNELSSPYILSLCLDREGNLWAGTDGGGLDRIKRKIFNSPAGFPPGNVQSLSPDDHGGWWIASGALGVSYWNTNGLRNYHVGPLQDAWEVLVDRRQQV